MNTGQDRDYGVAVKKNWRREYYRGIVKVCPLPTSRAVIVMLPGKEGYEIREAMMHGFREQNIVIVDRNPAVVAHLRRRFPRLRATLGKDFEHLPEKLQDTAIDVLSLDVCSPAGFSLARKLTVLAKAPGLLRNPFILGVTFLRGREKMEQDPAWKELSYLDEVVGTLEERREKARLTNLAAGKPPPTKEELVRGERFLLDQRRGFVIGDAFFKGDWVEQYGEPYPFILRWRGGGRTRSSSFKYKSPCGQTFMSLVYRMKKRDY